VKPVAGVCRPAVSSGAHRALHSMAECGWSGRIHSGQGSGGRSRAAGRMAQRCRAHSRVGAWGTAGPPEEADLVWTGVGEADPTPAACVRGADRGGRASGDAAAEPRGDPTAGQVRSRGFVWLTSVFVSQCPLLRARASVLTALDSCPLS